MRTDLAAEAVVARLIEQYRAVPETHLENRWLMLQAAHVAGQTRLEPHFKVHFLMLALAWETGDWMEISGQLFRIALVPLGHLTGRLPLGNSGKADISAFKSMPIDPALSALITSAHQSVQHHEA